MMEIHKDIEIVDLFLHLKRFNSLVIGDVHIGYEEALNKQGILIPRFQFKDTLKRFEKAVKGKKFDSIILLGDVKHEFGTISETEWRNTLQFIDTLSEYTKKIYLIKGNHDKVLEPIAEKRNLEVVDNVKLDDIFLLHGHIIPEENEDYKKAKIIIIGHEHPAISITDNLKTETYKCFIKGKFKGKILIVVPSFNLVTQGTDISKEDLLSPFLDQNLDNFEVFIVEDKIYNFGKIKNLRGK